jgi:hypothetical protein
VNDDDEPCAGEPHARFLGEGLETDATAHGGRTNPAGKPRGKTPGLTATTATAPASYPTTVMSARWVEMAEIVV